jgi:hypothetical protein
VVKVTKTVVLVPERNVVSVSCSLDVVASLSTGSLKWRESKYCSMTCNKPDDY